MLLEQQWVSRKTPADGKLEISPAAAARIGILGADFPLASGGREGRGRLLSLACTCGRGAGDGHVHHFVESPLLTALAPGTEVRIELDEDQSTLRIEAV